MSTSEEHMTEIIKKDKNKYRVTKLVWEVYHVLLCIGVWGIFGVLLVDFILRYL